MDTTAVPTEELCPRDDVGAPPHGHQLPPSSKKKKNKKKKKKKAGGNSLPLAEVFTYCEREAFRVTHDAVAGRCVVAARDLKPGELVLDEPPFAKVVRRDCASRQCAACCRQIHEAGRIEAGVPYAAYCSRKCKDQEEALRSAEAGALGQLAGIAAARDVDLDLLRMLLRLTIARAGALGLRPEEGQEGGEAGGQDDDQAASGEPSPQGSVVLQQWRNLCSLIHHRESMAAEWISVVRVAIGDLMQLVPAWARFDLEEAVELACRVNVNAHGLRDDSGSNLIVGLGLFPLTAMINHACRPNCAFVYYADKMEIRTLEHIPAGKELSVYYIDLLQSTSDRRRELLATKHFLCTCSRCENPDPSDVFLDSACCVDCGREGCLTSTAPPSPEEIIAAQLAQLGEALSNQSGAKGRSKKKGNGAHEASGGGAVSEIHGDVSVPPISATGGRSNDEHGNGVMYCSACGRQYPAKVIEESVARAKMMWDGAMTILRAKNFPVARKSLEKWLEDYDAGTVMPVSGSKKKATKKDRVKLHPANAMVMQTLVPMANCCNYEEDHSASARHLRRAVAAMEAVYPPNYPELGDFHAALADAIGALLEKRGQALPPKTRNELISERRQALQRAAAIRSVCLGNDHPITKEAARALARA